MAKKKRSTKSGNRTTIVRMPAARQAAPIIKVSAPRAAPAKRKRRSSSRRRSGVGGFGSYRSSLSLALGGMAYGFAVKQGWIAKLPAIPVIGRTGAAAILLHEMGKRNIGGELVKQGAVAATVIAGYQLGMDGSITGAGDHHFATAGDDYYTGEDEAWPEEYEADGDDDGDEYEEEMTDAQ